jgi:hypothetical protein
MYDTKLNQKISAMETAVTDLVGQAYALASQTDAWKKGEAQGGLLRLAREYTSKINAVVRHKE